MLDNVVNIPKIPELRKRLLITVLLLTIYRLGVAIPTPGVNAHALTAFFSQNSGTLFGLFNLFTGGAFEHFSIVTLGIMPYISAAIIIDLLTAVFPYLEKLKKEGELGRKKIVQYTRYGTVVISIIQGFVISYGLESMHAPGGASIVINPGFSFRLLSALTLTTGTILLMWLGEEITERGIGNGISLIIYAGIVARMPSAIFNTFRLVKSGEMNVLVLLFLAVLMVLVVAVIIFVELGQRKIPVQYAQRIVGRRMYGGQETFLPLKVNTSGVIPPIFASSLLMVPATITSMSNIPWLSYMRSYLMPGNMIYNLFYAVLIIFFTFFYTAVTYNPVDVADNLKKYGGYVPGIRPGKSTSDYIDRILTRITVGGALYLTVICVLPTILVSKFNVPFYFGGTSLLIVIGVALDTIAQIESQLIMRNYDGLMKNTKIKGRRW